MILGGSMLGLDLDEVPGALSVADFRSPIYDGIGTSVFEGDDSVDSALQPMLKVARLIAEFAGDLEVTIPSTTTTLGTIERAVEAGYGDEDASELVKVIGSDAGVSFAD